PNPSREMARRHRAQASRDQIHRPTSRERSQDARVTHVLRTIAVPIALTSRAFRSGPLPQVPQHLRAQYLQRPAELLVRLLISAGGARMSATGARSRARDNDHPQGSAATPPMKSYRANKLRTLSISIAR